MTTMIVLNLRQKADKRLPIFPGMYYIPLPDICLGVNA